MQEMTTIPPAQWGSFLARFSAEHSGQEADVLSVDHEVVRPIAIRLPLIRMETSGTPGGEPELHVSAGDSTGAVEGIMPHPIRIAVREWDGGESAELEMQSRDGDAIRVRIRGSSGPVQ